MRGKHVAPHHSVWGWLKMTLGITGLIVWSIIMALVLVLMFVIVTLKAVD